MGFLDEDMPDAITELLDDYGQTITWNGGDYSCIASRRRKGGTLEMYGVAIQCDLLVVVCMRLFGGNPPTDSDTIVFAGRTYRIDNIITSPGEGFLILACVSPSRGA